MKVKRVKEKDRPYVFQYDEIVKMKYKGKDGYYCDDYWYPTYDWAFNSRAASILVG